MNQVTKGKQASVKLQDIQKLVEMLDKSGLDALELEVEGMKLRLLKHKNPAPVPASPSQAPVFMMAPGVAPATVPAPPVVPVQAEAQKAAVPPRPPQPAEAPPVQAPAASKHTEVKSPMVGTFYRAPAPGAEPFVKVGDKVRKGQTLCIIEAMKLMNEIECETAGTVVDILIENAQSVEYGEVLMHVEPAG